MVDISFKGGKIALKGDETILDALLREGHDISYSCKAGACQSCMMRCSSGEVPAEAQSALKDTLTARGYFLACKCKPENDISVESIELSESSEPAEISYKKIVSDNVVVLRLTPDAKSSLLEAFGGQYVNITSPENIARSYSIANIPKIDGCIELHIRKIPDGEFSSWAYDKAEIGDKVSIREPAGECFYFNPDGEEFDILLAGTGTGLAPLYAIAKDALLQNHKGKITLLHGALKFENLYFLEKLRQLAKKNNNFDYIPCVLDGDNIPDYCRVGSFDEIVESYVINPMNMKYYVCGAPDMVELLKKKIFLKGASFSDIYSDSFLIRGA